MVVELGKDVSPLDTRDVSPPSAAQVIPNTVDPPDGSGSSVLPVNDPSVVSTDSLKIVTTSDIEVGFDSPVGPANPAVAVPATEQGMVTESDVKTFMDLDQQGPQVENIKQSVGVTMNHATEATIPSHSSRNCELLYLIIFSS